MIKIEAIVRPERINSVTVALEQAGCGGFHYQNVTGQGTQRGVEVFTGRGSQMVRAAGSKTLVVTIIPDDLKEAVVNAIIEAARSPDGGRIGDGKIIISRVEDVIRVRTGEHGESRHLAKRSRGVSRSDKLTPLERRPAAQGRLDSRNWLRRERTGVRMCDASPACPCIRLSCVFSPDDDGVVVHARAFCVSASCVAGPRSRANRPGRGRWSQSRLSRRMHEYHPRLGGSLGYGGSPDSTVDLHVSSLP